MSSALCAGYGRTHYRIRNAIKQIRKLPLLRDLVLAVADFIILKPFSRNYISYFKIFPFQICLFANLSILYLSIQFLMLQHSIERLPRSRWRARIRLLSIGQVGKFDWKHEKPQLPILSNSPLSTPSSSPPHLRRDSTNDDTVSLLTPLEVHNEDYYTPLTNHKSVILGGMMLPPPPPPPRRKLLLGGGSIVEDPAFQTKLFLSRKTRALSEGTIVNQVCFICQELLETKLVLEKLVSLQCGDCVHGECLQAAIDYSVARYLESGELLRTSNSPELRSILFPTCKGHVCTSARLVMPVYPIDEGLIESTVYDAILTLKLAKVNRQERLDEAATETKLEPSNTSSPLNTPLTCQSSSYLQSRYFIKEDQTLRPKSVVSELQPPRNHHLEVCYDSRPVSQALSGITTLTVSVRISEHERIPLEQLKNSFIKHMIDSCGIFDLSMLVALGPLRLVDRLLVSLNNCSYALSKVYLFANFLIVWETNLPVMFSLNDILSIGTPELSVVQFLLCDHAVTSVKLHSETASIIEKWGIAISDPGLIVPSDIFTSTLSIFELDNNSIPWVKSFGKQVSPIAEMSAENSPIENEPVSHGYQDNASIGEQSVSLNITAEFALLPPISPLIIRKLAVLAYNYSDSDSDSDNELISQVMNKVYGPT